MIVAISDRRSRSFCVLMVLWANLHPSFTFGLALFYVFAGYSCCEGLARRNYGQCRRTLYVVALFLFVR